MLIKGNNSIIKHLFDLSRKKKDLSDEANENRLNSALFIIGLVDNRLKNHIDGLSDLSIEDKSKFVKACLYLIGGYKYTKEQKYVIFASQTRENHLGHKVTYNSRTEFFSCDCESFEKGEICKHVIACLIIMNLQTSKFQHLKQEQALSVKEIAYNQYLFVHTRINNDWYIANSITEHNDTLKVESNSLVFSGLNLQANYPDVTDDIFDRFQESELAPKFRLHPQSQGEVIYV